MIELYQFACNFVLSVEVISGVGIKVGLGWSVKAGPFEPDNFRGYNVEYGTEKV